MDKKSVNLRKEGAMGRTLKWVDHVLRQSRLELNAQKPEQAVSLLDRLICATDLSEQDKVELLEQLGEAYSMLRNWRLARKSYREALKLRPDAGHLYQRLARAIASDPAMDARRAGRYYRNALKFLPRNVALLCEAGTFFADMGRWKLSLRCLQRAVDLAPEDLGVLATLVEVLCRAERFDEARRAVRISRFRFRGEHRLNGLQQAVDCSDLQSRQKGCISEPAGNVVPFLRIADSDDRPVRQKRWRKDSVSTPRPHWDLRQSFWDNGRSG
jgi:tetratricopeptide (TPR) repeat protein